MEGSSLFNTSFIGGNFIWWIGQVADDSSWRINISEKQFPEPESGVPGWGYRYKVRIIGQHDDGETIIESDQLPWAQVMYPVWGGGQGSTFMTPGLKQGMFVFGFFMDGQDMQVPIIMGVLGNNSKTTLERMTGTQSDGKNFTPQSFYATNQNPEPNEQKKLKDANLAVDDNVNLSQESSDATHQRVAADTKKDRVLDRKHALACPNPDRQSDIKNIQTVTETLTEKIQAFQESVQSLEGAGGLPVVQGDKDIDAAIEASSSEVAKYMKGVFGQVQQFANDQYNEKTAPMLNLSIPSHRLDLLKTQVSGLEKIACMFNGFAGVGLAALIAAALKNAFQRKKKKKAEDDANDASATAGFVGVSPAEAIPFQNQLNSPGSEYVPDHPKDGYYSPIPLCSAEELVGEVLGTHINDIMNGFDAAILPVIQEVSDSLGGGVSEVGEEPQSGLSMEVDEANVLGSLESGHLVNEISSEIGQSSGVNVNTIGNITNALIGGNYGVALTNLFFLAGKDDVANAGAVASVLGLVKGGDLIGGFGGASGVLDADPALMNGAGMIFDSIESGNIPELVNRVGNLAASYPNILQAVVGRGSASAGPNLVSSGFGAMGGLNFDIATSMGFIKSITKIFDCDPKAECSPNDIHTMQGGGGDGGRPSIASVAKSAQKKSQSTRSGKTLAQRRSDASKRNKSVSRAEINADIAENKAIEKKFAQPEPRFSPGEDDYSEIT